MKYKRLTERDEYGNADIIGVSMPNVYYCVEFDEVNILTTALNRLAELEDKIESGEIISTKQEERSDQEVSFFVEHNDGVRKLFADDLKDRLQADLEHGDITQQDYEVVVGEINYCLGEVEE